MAYVQPGIRIFLVAVNGTTRAMYQEYFDTRPEILNWFGILPNTLLVASRHEVSVLTALIHQRFPVEWFLITEIDSHRTNGFINQAVWDFINQPRSSGRWG